MGNPVLKNAQGADNRAVHAPEKERKDHQPHNHAHIEGQYGRQELHLGHPSQIAVQHAGNV